MIALRALLAACVALILGLTLVPQVTGPDPAQAALGPFGERGLADALANVLLFVPVGLLAQQALPRRWRPLFFGAALSVAIELMQLIIPGRFPSFWDVAFNAGGTAVGITLARHAVALLQPPPQRRPALALLALSAALGTLVGGAALFAPGAVDLPLGAEWTPITRTGDVYGGRVTAARLGSQPLPHDAVLGAAAPMARVSAGDTLTVSFLVGPRPAVWVPVFRIMDSHEDPALTLSVHHDDVAFNYRSRAARLHLDQPNLRLSGALAHRTLGDAAVAAVWFDSAGACMRVDQHHTCARPSFADTWALLLYPVPGRLGWLLRGAWVMLLFLPVGLWAPSARAAMAAAAAATAGLFTAAPLLALPVPAGAALAAVAGVVGGHLGALWFGGRPPSARPAR